MLKRAICHLLCGAAAFFAGSAGASPVVAMLDPEPAVTFVRGFARVGPVVGYRGGAYVGAWRRPYAWPPGGAIAAGAAVGVLSAADAVGYATVAAPANGLCWYYTDDNASQGFWDVCQ
ncbi:hypothetical protein ACNHKD_10700 [Methylocystis sp. JAN1]|uniref:hypothetical protein n=1 Tax=Methylocystis sp. JAN1 TaxID=3397211 RepID=UPI003FA2A18D